MWTNVINSSRKGKRKENKHSIVNKLGERQTISIQWFQQGAKNLHVTVHNKIKTTYEGATKLNAV